MGLLSNLAWPIIVLSVFLLLLGPIRERVKNVTNVKYKDVDISFQSGIKQLEEETKVVKSSRQVGATKAELAENGQRSEWIERLRVSAADNPRFSIIDMWSEVEQRIDVLAHTQGAQRSAIAESRNLTAAGTISPEIGSMIYELWVLRTRAGTDMEFHVRESDALVYLDAVVIVASVLDEAIAAQPQSTQNVSGK
jgi:hypothetical protein